MDEAEKDQFAKGLAAMMKYAKDCTFDVQEMCAGLADHTRITQVCKAG